jgi:single-stranded-DNA-specific exonuclease
MQKNPFYSIPNSTPRLASKVELRQLSGDPSELAKRYGVSHLCALFLAARGLLEENTVKNFLSPTLREGLPSPQELKNLEAAAKRIAESIRRNDKIVVFSDFDVDGISSAAQLVPYLQALGGDVSHYAPNRFSEGYGLSKAAVQKLSESGARLLITVDCGATNHEAVEFAQKRYKLPVIVLDHHQMHGESPAEILVNPAQSGCGFTEYKLCAAGIVWFLLIALRREFQGAAPDPKEYLDLAALGTICDMVPLMGPNRVIAARGVELIRDSKRPGIVALKAVSRVTGRVSAGGVSFGLGPRINAAGRLADASLAFELLTTSDLSRAQVLAQQIDKLNEERKSVEERVKLRCLELLADEVESLSALSVFDPSFHAGVIGIVAQRLVELFHKPAAVMSPGQILVGKKSVDVVKGSVRSINGFHVAEALQALSELLLSHGGHSEAGGFSIEQENIPRFKEAFSELAERAVPPSERQRVIYADGEVKFRQIDYTSVTELERLQPFGIGNSSPIFTTSDVSVESVSQVGEKNLKLRFNDGEFSLTGLFWRVDSHELLQRGERVNIAFTPELNSYQGVTSVQLNLKEVWR